MKKLPVVFLFCMSGLFSSSLFAQNCTVNAGVDQLLCSSQPVTLTAVSAGTLSASPNYQWSLISGPAATIATPNSLTTTVTGINPGTYVFRFSAVCQDGVTAVDSVIVRVIPDPAQPLAGADQQTCLLQSLNLLANTPPGGQTGQWLLTAATTGATIAAASLPATTVTVSSGGLKQLIWRISNGACFKDDTLDIRVLRPAAVSAGADINVSCNGTCATLNGSDPGIAPQVGLWELVSGPSTPLFANPNLRNTAVCNLVPGSYTFRWTVSGPCASGSDEVNVAVANIYSTPSLGNAVSYTSFCNNSNVTSLVLRGNALKPGESAVWSVVSSAAAPALATPASASTVVSGLNGTGIHQFRYTVSNANCTSNVLHTVYFTEAITGLTAPADQQTICDSSSAIVPITVSGLTNTSGLTRNYVLVSGPVTTGVTATRTASGFNDTWTITGLRVAGKYVFRFEYRNACSALFRDVNIYVSKAPSAATAGSNQLLPCGATSTALAGNTPSVGKGNWSQVSGPNTATISSTTATTPTVSNLVEGAYRFRWTVNGGSFCAPNQSEVTIVKASTTVAAANAGPDLTVCPGSFRLNGNTPGATQTGKWTVSPTSGISFSNANDPAATVSGVAASTTYTFTWTISNACSSSSDAVVVTANANAAVLKPDAGADACLPAGTTSIALSGNSNANSTSQWTALNGGTVSNANSAAATAAVSANGTYRFVYALSAPGCTTLYDTVTYTISLPASAAAAGADQDLCATLLPSSATLTASAPAVGTGIWEQTAGDAGPVIGNAGASNTTVSNLLAGQYEFRYLVTNGVCSSSEDRVIINVTQAPTTANAGNDTARCSVISTTAVTLAANTPASGTGAWTIVSGPQGTAPAFGNAGSPASTISGLTTGIYTLRWTIASGGACAKSADEMVLTVSRSADATATTNALCDITSAQLTGNTNSAGTWTVSSKPSGSPAVTITQISAESALADNLVRGAYSFLYTIPAIGNCPASSNSRTVTIYAPPSVANAGPDQTLCSGITTAVLTGNAPSSGTGAWTLVSGPNTPIAGSANTVSYDTSLTNLAEGLYTYRYSINTNSACTASTDDITVLKERTASTAAGQRYCNATAATLTGNAPVYSTGKWSQVSGLNAAAIQLPSSPSSQVNGLAAGTYVFRWTIDTVGSCAATFSDVQVSIDTPVSAVSAGADTTVCAGAASPLLGVAQSGSAAYTWSPATYLSDATSAQPAFNGTAYPGTYTYTLTKANGSCTASDQMVITVRNYPADFTLVNACTARFTGVDLGAGASYNWNFGSGATPATATTLGPHTVQYATTGAKTVSLSATDSYGCSSTKTTGFTLMCTLPLNLLRFTAEQTGSAVVLHWEVSNAVNVRQFVVERSTDGTGYDAVGAVTFTPSVTAYRFTDESVSGDNRKYFYRLKSVDLDASYQYSPVRTLLFNTNSQPITVSPVPFTDRLGFTIATGQHESAVEVQLFSSMGQKVRSRVYGGLQAGIHRLYLDDVSHLPGGTYLLRLQSNAGKLYHVTVVKK